MSCATELLHPANFCPVCGARLAAPAPDGSAATLPGGTTPVVVSVPDAPSENVVYLPADHGTASADSGTPPVNRRAYDYEGVERPVDEQPPSAGPMTPLPTPIRSPEVAAIHARHQQLLARAAELEAALPAFGSHGPTPQPHELVPPPRDDQNPFGDFFGDGPSAWLEDDDSEEEQHRGEPRVVGTMLAAGSVTMLLAAWAVWGIAMYRGAAGAESGGFVLLAMLMWIWYLSMPRAQQHSSMLRRHAAVKGFVDRRTIPLRDRTEGQVTMRRERDRYRAMRDERTRRIAALGEGAYRTFRTGQLPADLQAGAQRVLAIERQMLTQDQRIHVLEHDRRTGSARSDVADSAADPGAEQALRPPQGGHLIE